MENEIQFDFVKAQNLISTLEGFRTKLGIAARDIKTAAPVACAWWIGESQEAFAERFREAFPDMDDYGRVVDETLNYLKKVSSDKSSFEKMSRKLFQ